AFSFCREAPNQAFVACVLEDKIKPSAFGYYWKAEDTTAHKDHMIHIRLDSEDYDECTDQLIRAIASNRDIDLSPDESMRVASSLAKVSAEVSPYNIAYLIDRSLIRREATQAGQTPYLSIIELCDELALAHPIKNAPVDIKRPKITLGQLSFSPELRLQLDKMIAISRKIGGSSTFTCLEQVSAQKSMRALFTGVPGTGKTAAAEAIAYELGKDLWVADFSKIKGMYVGESEKALKSLFKKAQAAQVVLLIDEADGLLCDRSTTSNESARNLTNLALQLIWDYRGILILASNFKEALDPAMGRRLPHQIDFKAPGDREAGTILENMLKPDAPLVEGIDFQAVVRGLGLTGGLLVSVMEEVFGLLLIGELTVITEEALRVAAEKVALSSHTGAKKELKRTLGFAV
ncbi:MAG: AAA family ATPase, partial [Proteobacteria bacterium]